MPIKTLHVLSLRLIGGKWQRTRGPPGKKRNGVTQKGRGGEERTDSYACFEGGFSFVPGKHRYDQGGQPRGPGWWKGGGGNFALESALQEAGSQQGKKGVKSRGRGGEIGSSARCGGVFLTHCAASILFLGPSLAAGWGLNFRGKG